jgi:hypothetical protein
LYPASTFFWVEPTGSQWGVARRGEGGGAQAELFSFEPAQHLAHRLDGLRWPDQARVPVNRASVKVRDVVWHDLVASPAPVVVAGYSAIGQVVSLIADWLGHHDRGGAGAAAGPLRIVVGTEPFGSSRQSFDDPTVAFTREVEHYWLERGVSLRRSAQLIVAADAVRAGRVDVRAVVGATPLHAKVYVGEHAATVGSSNFTDNGLHAQVEANARFEREAEHRRYDELVQVAENFWVVGTPWNDELLALLDALLQVVGWREALARACAELLEGEWAERYLRDASGAEAALWPSQLVGIAQAMWIIENVGSVLVADATGSGKTRMGAHLVRSVRDRLWSTGRVRRDLTVLVCPPAVEQTWRHEAIACGLSINTVSHGKLSRAGADGERIEQRAVRRAQLLAVDEAHNFLNRSSNRTRSLRDNLADHVMLFTATPISKGAADLLDLVALLGPDNFEDETHGVLKRLERRGSVGDGLSPDEERQLRTEIQRFTVRRTKTQINELVDRDPEAYRHPDTGRVCRYPAHRPITYDTGESASDSVTADQIRAIASTLSGVALLPRDLSVPARLRKTVSDEQWLTFRLRSASGLAAHHVLGALRSSRAALHEHVYGTAAAVDHFGLDQGFKAAGSGDTLGKVHERGSQGPPAAALECELPDWLTDADAWSAACAFEAERYRSIGELLAGISDARERRKAELLAGLAGRHDRVLAFDHHLITLTALASLMGDGVDVLIATGQAAAGRDRVQRVFAPTASGADAQRAIALCSDAMNEGLNLQGASAIVHLDLPTTLRVAEQRVGRVDRMDSPHDEIEAWWPRDGASFATRANERLVRRAEESEALLGSNLAIPELSDASRGEALIDDVVDVDDVVRQVDGLLDHPTDELFDALDPVRRLVTGPDALIPAADYAHYRSVSSRVVARVAPLVSSRPWAFLAVRSSAQGAPRWMLVDPTTSRCETDLRVVTDVLRSRLRDDPADRRFDEAAATVLDRCLGIAAVAEVELLPRRIRRALDQLHEVATHWAAASRAARHEVTATGWLRLAEAARPVDGVHRHDPFALAERWLSLVTPLLDDERDAVRGRRYVLLHDITARLRAEPLAYDEVIASFADLPDALPLADRVSACIVGVPAGPGTDSGVVG